MRQTQEIYDALNTQLITELPKLVDFRVPYLDPSFEALVKLQHRFSDESYSRLQDLRLSDSPTDGTPERSDGELAQVMQELRELSICGLA